MTEPATERARQILAQLETKGRQLDARDLFIGTICLQRGYAVLAHNLEHFKRITGLQVVSEDEVLNPAFSSSITPLEVMSRVQPGNREPSYEKDP